MTADPTRVAMTLRGLSARAEIVVDRWGVPHVYAASVRDAFLVQGFNAARERLWQIDFWRRRGLGELAAVFGPEYVERDRAARLFLYRGDMDAEWAAYGGGTHQAATAFVEGVNAFVQLTREDPGLLPAEFRALGYEPAPWAAADVARIRSHGLFYNVREEVARALTLRDFGAEVERLRRRLEPDHDLTVPDGLDVSVIPDDVLRVYDLAIDPPAFPGLDGSNNWVLSADRAATGRPMLCNDPHRDVTALPGLRYIVHLSAPGLDVIGGGEPALPGISIGHNGVIAFGLTIFPIDQEDLYVYETAPDDPLAYRYGDGWERMRVVRETVAVQGGDPVDVELLFTRHGPVVHADPQARTAFAVRAAWLGPGMAPYLGSVEYMGARDWPGFVAAMDRWGAPPENQIYADTAGNIGWRTGGRTPVRPNWDGTLPVPGDGRYEWDGFHGMDELPSALNPARGWIATANEMNLPADFPADRHVTYDWYPAFRRQRIDEVLGAASASSLQDMVALQHDVVSLPARQILARARELGVALGGLSGWDAELRAGSAEAALFEVWYRRHLRRALLRAALEQLVPADAVDRALARIAPADDVAGDPRVDLALLEDPGRVAEPRLVTILEDTLRDAVADLEELLGEDREAWSWGRLHVARSTHPLAALLDTIPADRLRAGPLPRGGSSDTVGHTAYGPDFVQTNGSTFRVVIDVGNWDASLAMNAPGQSGRLGDRHATDLCRPWTAGESFPLAYTRAAVDEAAEQVIELEP